MLVRLDRWFGEEIMQPPIIWLCQRTGMTQRAVYRYGWMLATWTLVMRISFQGIGDWVFSVLAIVFTVMETARAAFMPDAPAPRSDFLRRLVLLLTIYDIVRIAAATGQHRFHGLNWSHAWDLFALIAEYAKTIDTIPPRRTREKAGRNGRSAIGNGAEVGL